ncbi:MAG: RNA 2'-phosphotransferase [Gemmataceae bacterium]|nr:RNA 2'-phosphotransferase [Gemmataceae bacterium]
MEQSATGDRLFRTVLHALRHDPWKYGLELDADGFARLDDVATGLRFDRYEWALLKRTDVEAVVRQFGVERLEVRGGLVGASYGHSFSHGILPPLAAPPDVLFHGTTAEAVEEIRRDGLKPMGRRFVHLTADREYAARVAAAKGGRTVLLVQAKEASRSIGFRRANAHVWLTDEVPPAFLDTASAAASSDAGDSAIFSS